MEFTFYTVYDQKAVTAMVRALRKTVRKKRNRRTHVLGWIVTVLALLLTLPLNGEPFVLEGRMVITWAVVLVMLYVMFREDAINARNARKRALPGTMESTVTFTEEGFHSSTEMGDSDWHYEKILQIVEMPDYFVFIFSKNHGQIYDKRHMTGGVPEDFARFITEKTGTTIQKLK